MCLVHQLSLWHCAWSLVLIFADSATVSRTTRQASTESPSRHRSPTRFAPTPHQSDLPPAHPGFQRPRTAPNTVPTPLRELNSSTAPETTPQGWFARHQQQERLWQGSSQQQAQQHSRAQQLQAQQHRALHFPHRPEAGQTQRQSRPELSTPFASQPPRPSRSEDRPLQQSPDWHTNNSWHVSAFHHSCAVLTPCALSGHEEQQNAVHRCTYGNPQSSWPVNTGEACPK